MDFEEIHKLTFDFDPISLEEMDDIKLLKRLDTKYTIPLSMLPQVLAKVKEDYYVLEIDNRRYTNYKTVYYDSPDFLFYKDHYQRLHRRLKVRTRSYIESNLHFFELKNKRNAQTVKTREEMAKVPKKLNDEQLEAVQDEYEGMRSYFPTNLSDSLEQKLTNTFTRITLVNKKKTTRCTIDLNLAFAYPDGQEDAARYYEIAIIELKQTKAVAPEGIAAVMKELSIKVRSISKYVLGVLSLYPDIKYNAFKPLFVHIKKLQKKEYQLENNYEII